MTRAGERSWTWTARLPSDLRTAYQLCPSRSSEVPRRPLTEEEWATLTAEGVPDPPPDDALPPGCVFGNPGTEASVLSLPDALPQPWRERRETVPCGELRRVEIGRGAATSIVTVYRPADAEPTDDLALAVLFDGGTLVDLDVAATFDNLIHERATEPFVAVLVESIHGSTRRGPTRVRSLTAPAEFERFVVDELVPYLVEHDGVTTDPSRSVLVGQSLGGLASLWLAHEHPDRFRHVVSQSASLWWPGGDGQVSGEDVLAAFARGIPPLGLFVEAGTEERQVLGPNRHLRAILERGRHPYAYREYRGGHDYACWRGGIADGLLAALGRQP